VETEAIIAIAGIAGTLTGTLFAPLLAELMRRRSAKKDRQYGARMDVYSDLLEVTARLSDNASTWSAIPLADLKETDDAQLNRIMARVRTVASEKVKNRMAEISKVVHEFNRLLYYTREVQARRNEGNFGDTRETIDTRMQLGALADRLRGLVTQLESDVRRETTR
jgi:hypothetical protein